jgi:hypothetical protein
MMKKSVLYVVINNILSSYLSSAFSLISGLTGDEEEDFDDKCVVKFRKEKKKRKRKGNKKRKPKP